MEYVNEAGLIIQLNQRLLYEHSTPATTRVTQDSTIKDIVLNGQTAIMMIHDNDIIHLEWLTADQIKMSVFGLLPADEMILLAESLQ
ncbi:hypothetical protein GCM10010965_26560 [Caldalkalibacillus thermarum]|nr:hypothetical protein GCM10010965_26560 [Caldalkalibacillus thermarum]